MIRETRETRERVELSPGGKRVQRVQRVQRDYGWKVPTLLWGITLSWLTYSLPPKYYLRNFFIPIRVNHLIPLGQVGEARRDRKPSPRLHSFRSFEVSKEEILYHIRPMLSIGKTDW